MSGEYIVIQDLRDEGITIAMLSDAQATQKIKEWSGYLERVTGQWFEARTIKLTLDTELGQSLSVAHPIIQINAAYTVTGRGSQYKETEIDLDNVIIYNRHLTMGLQNPDDRFAPRIEYQKPNDYIIGYGTRYPTSSFARQYQQSRQRVRLEGVFGWTELQAGDTPGESSPGSQIPSDQGSTPFLVEKIVKLLVLRDMPLLVDIAFRDDLRKRWSLISEKTADQSYRLADPSKSGQAGAWTGDPEIDSLIAIYATPLSSVDVI